MFYFHLNFQIFLSNCNLDLSPCFLKYYEVKNILRRNSLIPPRLSLYSDNWQPRGRCKLSCVQNSREQCAEEPIFEIFKHQWMMVKREGVLGTHSPFTLCTFFKCWLLCTFFSSSLRNFGHNLTFLPLWWTKTCQHLI